MPPTRTRHSVPGREGTECLGRVHVDLSAVYPGKGVAEPGAAGAESVRSMVAVGISERDAADYQSIFGEREEVTDELRVCGERGLWNGAEAEALGGEEECLNV